MSIKDNESQNQRLFSQLSIFWHDPVRSRGQRAASADPIQRQNKWKIAGLKIGIQFVHAAIDKWNGPSGQEASQQRSITTLQNISITVQHRISSYVETREEDDDEVLKSVI